MTKRNTQLRRNRIVEAVNEHQQISVDALAKLMQTSEVTIRKDLTFLEKAGLLLRRMGGAIKLPTDATEVVSEQKQLISDAAIKLIQDHNRIIIDSGSTTSAMIAKLESKQGLVVMTNSLNAAKQLEAIEGDHTLLMTGGTWDPHSESFQGQVAEQVLKSYNFDQLFIGADGIDVERGSTSFNELLGLSRVMAQVSRQVVMLVESYKFERKIPNVELNWDDIDILITDAGIDAETVSEIEKHNVQVIVVGENR